MLYIGFEIVLSRQAFSQNNPLKIEEFNWSEIIASIMSERYNRKKKSKLLYAMNVWVESNQIVDKILYTKRFISIIVKALLCCFA